MLRSVKVLDQTDFECALVSSCVKSIPDHQTFQSVFQSLSLSAGLSLRRIYLKASATAPETAAIDVPDVTASFSDVVDLVRRAEEYDPCVVTFVVTKSTEAVSLDLPATAAASRAAAPDTAAQLTAIPADEVPLAEAAELPEVRAAETAEQASDPLPAAEPASRATLKPAAASTSVAALAAASAVPEAAVVTCAAAAGTAQISTQPAPPAHEVARGAHIRLNSTPPLAPEEHVISSSCVTGEQGAQQCTNRAHRAMAAPLAKLLLAKGCSFWASDTTELQEQVITAVQQVFGSVTPALYTAVMACSASTGPDVTEGLQQAAALLGSPPSSSTGSAPESIEQAAAAVSGRLLALSRNTAVLRVLARDSWHPVRKILNALTEAMVSHSQRGQGSCDDGAMPGMCIRQSLVLHGHQAHLQDGAPATPPRHMPMLRALEAVPPPQPWRACAANIVQLSVDWYLQPGGASLQDFRQEIAVAVAGIEQGEARMLFPVGMVALDTSEWLRGTRWYLWRLPQAPQQMQLTAHKAMQQALLAALSSGTSPAALGTPALARPGADSTTHHRNDSVACAPAAGTTEAVLSVEGAPASTAAHATEHVHTHAAGGTAIFELPAAAAPPASVTAPDAPATLQAAATAAVLHLSPAPAASAPGAAVDVAPTGHPAPGASTTASPAIAASGPRADANTPHSVAPTNAPTSASPAATAHAAPTPASAATSEATLEQPSQDSDEPVESESDDGADDLPQLYITPEEAMQIYPDPPRSASAGRFADFLISNGCHSGACLKSQTWNYFRSMVLVFKHVHGLFCSVTPDVYAALMKCAEERNIAPAVCDAMAEGAPLFGLPESEAGDEGSTRDAVLRAEDCISNIQGQPLTYSVLERDAWQPVRRIVVALYELLGAFFDQEDEEEGDHEEGDHDSDEEAGVYVTPGEICDREAEPPHRIYRQFRRVEHARHLPLQRALEAAPPPEPWQASASRIVQVSVDWYLLHSPGVLSGSPHEFVKTALKAVVDLPYMQETFPFAYGIAAVKTCEWLRPWRWYLWRLPDASPKEHRAAHEDMRAALSAALDSGASPVAIGTPKLQSLPPASEEPASDRSGPSAAGSAQRVSVANEPACGLPRCRLTREDAMKLYSEEARAASAGQLADLLAAKGCLFWACDSPALREEVFRAVHQVLHGVSPELLVSVQRDRRAAAPAVRDALQEFGSVLGQPGGADERPPGVMAARHAVLRHISSIETSASLHRVLMRETWHPVAAILGALHTLLTAPLAGPGASGSAGAAHAVAEGAVQQGMRVPGYIPITGPPRTPARHLPLLRALEAAPPPEPWTACASHIVQLSVEWYLDWYLQWQPDTESDLSKAGGVTGLMLAAVDEVQKQKARLPFPVGIVAVDTSEWLRGTRWYLWRLPWAPREEQLAAHKAMRQALLDVLRSGASAAAVGTPAFVPPAAGPADAAASHGVAAPRRSDRHSKRKAATAATPAESPAKARARTSAD